ncbi:tRNA 2-thiouridine(34) synthase MnmA [bacterium CG1_02_42_9]|nr:MAG: tRNA 2-thiouridine(34) synthase MnmA [bacterium CG1_02_42_9]
MSQKNSSQPKIAVAMSGGVDSGTAAFLLKKQGFRVFGIHLKLFATETESDRQNRQRVRKTATMLGIPYEIIDLSQGFADEIIADFIVQYSHGQTPNPCVFCNPKIKFGKLLEYALDAGYDFLATGHYAKVRKVETGNQKRCKIRYELLKASDAKKDQSYFLYRLNQKQLSKILFPLGNLTKEKVKMIAKSEKLPVAEASESHEICFLKGEDYRQFLQRKIPQIFQPGPIQSTDGKIVGTHLGLPLYTIGQRKGIKTHHNLPLYVKCLEMKTNTLIVGSQKDLMQDTIFLENLSWVAGFAPESENGYAVKIRYQGESTLCQIAICGKDRVQLLLKNEIFGVSPGQSAVIYKKNEVLGGGIIVN